MRTSRPSAASWARRSTSPGGPLTNRKLVPLGKVNRGVRVVAHDEHWCLEWWLVAPPVPPPVVGPIASLGTELAASHYLGADALAPHAGQGAVQRDGGIRLIDAMDYPAVEQLEQPLGAADRGVERHMLAGGVAIEGEVQVVDPGAGHRDSFCDRTQLLKYRPMGMAGLIAGADIMFGGRTPHPHHTRPSMVSQSSDGDPHGKPPASIPSRNDLRATPGVQEVVRLARRLCGHDGLARGHAQSLAWRAHGPTSRPALATEPADRHSTRLHESSAPRGQESAFCYCLLALSSWRFSPGVTEMALRGLPGTPICRLRQDAIPPAGSPLGSRRAMPRPRSSTGTSTIR